MKKLNPLVQLRKEYSDFINENVWRAYWRGTNNRIRQENGELLTGRCKQSELRFDLLNNPCERGVIAHEISIPKTFV